MPFYTEPTEAECFEAEQELLFEVRFRQMDREIRKMMEEDKLKCAKNTEQPLQTDNGYVCNRPGQCAKGQGGKCYSGFDCPDKAIAG